MTGRAYSTGGEKDNPAMAYIDMIKRCEKVKQISNEGEDR